MSCVQCGSLNHGDAGYCNEVLSSSMCAMVSDSIDSWIVFLQILDASDSVDV